MQETVFINQDQHEIETKRVTLVFNSDCATFYPDRVMLDPETTVSRFSQLQNITVLHKHLFNIVVPDMQPVTLDGLRAGHIGFKHLMGLIACSLELILLRKPFGWKWPETYLHPKYQGNLADLLLLLSSPKDFAALVTKLSQ